MSSRRYCDSCGQPLGSTRKKCHGCGGESIRADEAGTYKSNNGISYWFRVLIGRAR